MGRGDEEMFHKVSLDEVRPTNAFSAPPLSPIGVHGESLKIALMGHDDGHVLFSNQVLPGQLFRLAHYVRTAGVTKLLFYLPDLLADDVKDECLLGQDVFVSLDILK